MTKREIDKYFTLKEKDIILYINKSLSKNRIFNENAYTFFSECYIYILDRISHIDNSMTLSNYISTFIHNNARWENSSVKEAEPKQRRIKNIEFDSEKYGGEYNIDEFDYEEYNMDEEYQLVTELYYESLKDLKMKRVYEIYFIDKNVKGSDFAEYIKYSETVAYKLIKELKVDLRKFYEEYKIDKNNNRLC